MPVGNVAILDELRPAEFREDGRALEGVPYAQYALAAEYPAMWTVNTELRAA